MSVSCRKTVRLKTPNPLFESWLTEWKLQAEAIKSDAKNSFEKALESLRKYPLVLNSGKECLILEHFDASLCIKLDRRLAQHKRNGVAGTSQNPPPTNVQLPEPTSIVANDLPFSDNTSGSNATSTGNAANRKRKKDKSHSSEDKEARLDTSSPTSKKKHYLPKSRTGPFAILVTLLKNEETNGSKDWMSKSELQKAGQPLCDTSFTKPQQSGSFYTAWSSMSQLVTKQFVKKQGNPPRFSLTVSGRELSLNLVSLYSDEVVNFQVQYADPSSLLTATATATSEILAPGKKNVSKKSPVKKGRRKNIATQESVSSTQSDEPVESGPDFFTPGSFDVVLLVDTAETIGAQRKAEDETVRELTKLSVEFQVRKLNVGDFLWVARHRECGKELALPYIVERKRLDDLAKSIKDGRFHEQKFRLKSCGLHNLIYLVEHKRMEGFGLPLETLNFSITRTQVSDNFFVQIKRNHKASMLFLAQTTSVLSKLFESKTLFRCKKDDLPETFDLEDDILSLCTFNNFNHNIGKIRNFTVKEIFQKQLLKLHGVSSEMAWAIVQVYPTPGCIRNAFVTSGQGLLEKLQYGPLKRNVGPVVSRTLHTFYTVSQFSE